jgi:hypothetical protein
VKLNGHDGGIVWRERIFWFGKFSLNYPRGMATRPIRSRPNNGPISIPLKFEEAVAALLTVKPEPKKSKAGKAKSSSNGLKEPSD